jgi:cyclohexyl-isocyanide hydratase
VLHVPGGSGQEALMDDSEVLGWLSKRVAGGSRVFSVCTGALLLGAAGLLRGRRATPDWASVDLLPYSGASPVDERVIADGNMIFTAGVTAGIDGALLLAAELRGTAAAEEIQLAIAYAPEPPFNSGRPDTAPPAVSEAAKRSVAAVTARRKEQARRIGQRLGVTVTDDAVRRGGTSSS